MKGLRIILIAWILLSAFTNANLMPNDLKILGQKMAERKYKGNIHLNLYSNVQKAKVVESKLIHISVWNRFIHYKAEHLESFANNNYLINIDHKRKIILLNKNPQKTNVDMTQKVIPMYLDTIASELYSIQELKSNNDYKKYKLSNKNKEDKIEYTLFEIDTKNHKPLLVQIKYSKSLDDLTSIMKNNKSNYTDEPLLEMTYPDFEYLNSFNQREYDFSHILSIDNKNEAKLKKEYASYELVNYIKK